MNIFILSLIIKNCAKYHCDRHVIKMILETTQLLSTCHHIINPDQAEKWCNKGKIYKKTHMNHPSSIWTRTCKENYIWLCNLGIALCKEYAYRYDKQPNDHKCYEKLIFLHKNVPLSLSSNGCITKHKQCMPDEYKTHDSVRSYRIYYLNDKNKMLVWRKRGPPYWVPDDCRHVHYESEIKRFKTQLNKLDKRVRKTPEHEIEIQRLTVKISKLTDILTNLATP